MKIVDNLKVNLFMLIFLYFSFILFCYIKYSAKKFVKNLDIEFYDFLLLF